MEVHGTIIGSALLIAGIALLRASWMRSRGGKGYLWLAGWLFLAAGLAAFSHAWGGEVGTAYALLGLSLVAYGAVAAGIELRSSPARMPRDAALEPEERATNWRRGAAKALLAIVLSGVASIGIGVAFALYMPMATHNRIVIGGILVPVLWGGGMAWTLSDAKLLRATLLLLAISVACYAMAFLPRVMIEKFASVRGKVRSEFFDLNHTSSSMILVSLVIPKFARDARGKVWRTSESGH